MDVIVRSNDDEPLKFGTLIRFEKMNPTHPTKIPVVMLDGRECWCMGIILPDYPYIRQLLLDSGNPVDQWNFAVNLKSFFLRMNGN